MSKRRQPGDWVRLLPYSGFVGDSDRLPAQIQPEEEEYADWCSCSGPDCGDNDCREWGTLLTAPDPACNGERGMLCHVCECQMLDYEGEPPA